MQKRPDLEIPVPINFTFGFSTNEPIALTCRHKLRPDSTVEITITETDKGYAAKSDKDTFDVTCDKSRKDEFVSAVHSYLFALFVNGYVVDLDASSKFTV